jgi:hypothetical protein
LHFIFFCISVLFISDLEIVHLGSVLYPQPIKDDIITI